MSARTGSIIIEGVSPEIDAGRHPVKRVVGESLTVEADVFKEGHDVLAAVVRYRQLTPQSTEWQERAMKPLGNDRWQATFALPRNGRYAYTVEAWPDLFATWVSELKRKVDAGRDVHSELLEGAVLLEQTAARARPVLASDAQRLEAAAAVLKQGPSVEVTAAALDAGLTALASRYPDRTLVARHERELEVFVDRERGQYGSWYEFFPRSASGDPHRHGTFADAERMLPYIRDMGFDVVYLPPIHPIGRTARKGKNNSLSAGPEEPGSPWAIGAAEGGHKAVHPRLGTLEDFQRFVQRAAEHGIDVALDIAFQCSPDHPYVKEHPEWFHHRPDGTIKTAENPPKRYEDIVNFDWLGPARESLWHELESVILFWVERGVRIFRVDNPHTKPIPFWEWLIRRVQDVFPDVVFLSEAFTRPKVMKRLAKVGFTQSYTYFTWRVFKQELEEYLTELTTPPVADSMRGNLWPNTPDILPELLQRGGPPAFRIRGALAATLSSVWGMYSGFELCEGRALKGEEYLDSEKYELKAWDWDRPGNIRDFIASLNRIRRENRAFQLYKSLAFHRADSDRVLFYSRRTPDGTNQVLVALSLDPYEAQEAVLHVPLSHLGLPQDETYQVQELLSGGSALWRGGSAHVKLTPERPVAIWCVERFLRRESGFDYYD
ncbi:MAG: alpha-1,4-glucan--maltose-1-phosphate maltosyltransferase [Myxococcaceae bacterium]|nr:alpha-1,4-glucan--maltose-1-phosphate maltosyltransferase [Myxococcaceae bacterium]